MTSSKTSYYSRMTTDIMLSLLITKHLTDGMDPGVAQDTRSDNYQTFDPTVMDYNQRILWQEGTTCSNYESRGNDTPPLGIFHCPMPFEPSDYSGCCGEKNKQFCCPGSTEISVKWAIGVGAAMGCLFLGLCIICVFNKCTAICMKKSPESAPRPKIKINASRQMVRPIDKRTLLKTANYTVEKSWDQLHVKFDNREFYDKFAQAVLHRYQDVPWKDLTTEKEGNFKCSTGDPVTLRMLSEPRILIVTRTGNASWVMNDFQNICKNLIISDWTDRKTEPPLSTSIPLQPRLPTIGEEFHDAGEYSVKTSQTETEIKFISEKIFDGFKRILLFRYPKIVWSKYLQRDCAQIKLDNSKTITLHLWEDVRTIWLSGDGKKDWYNKEFQDLFSDATSGKIPDYGYVIHGTPTRSISEGGSRVTSASSHHQTSRDHPAAVYTVKTLDTGGFEVEFPSSAFLPKLKEHIQKAYPAITWQEYSTRFVTKIFYERGKFVSVHVATPATQMRKIWLYDDPGCSEWFNGEFRKIYAAVYHIIYNSDHTELQNKDGTMAPVESSL